MAELGRRLLAAGLDAVTYALTVAAVATVVSAAVSFAFGYGLWGVMYTLFLLTFALFAVATAVSWPGSAWKSPNLSFDLLSFGGTDEDEETTVPWVDTEPSASSGTADETDFQALVQRLPPARFLPAPPSRRLPTGLRLYLAALATAAVSYWLNVYGGVTA